MTIIKIIHNIIFVLCIQISKLYDQTKHNPSLNQHHSTNFVFYMHTHKSTKVNIKKMKKNHEQKNRKFKPKEQLFFF